MPIPVTSLPHHQPLYKVFFHVFFFDICAHSHKWKAAWSACRTVGWSNKHYFSEFQIHHLQDEDHYFYFSNCLLILNKILFIRVPGGLHTLLMCSFSLPHHGDPVWNTEERLFGLRVAMTPTLSRSPCKFHSYTGQVTFSNIRSFMLA